MDSSTRPRCPEPARMATQWFPGRTACHCRSTLLRGSYQFGNCIAQCLDRTVEADRVEEERRRSVDTAAHAAVEVVADLLVEGVGLNGVAKLDRIQPKPADQLHVQRRAKTLLVLVQRVVRFPEVP